jgi:hypothetical protein
MKTKCSFYSKVIVLLLFFIIQKSDSFAQIPQTIELDGNHLIAIKNAISADLSVQYNDLIKKADKLLAENKVYSVMDKNQVPPSGDKHDYMSIGPYWWPDSTKANGLPYIRKDGQVNPEYHTITDTDYMDYMIDDAQILALAYYFSEKDKYASHAAKLLKTWFLDEKTRQNPNLNFGQGIPGINTGRGIGIIESRNFTKAIDASILIKGSKFWSINDDILLKKWFSEYLNWLIISPIGIDESDEHNNHGTYYDVQVINYALFVGNDSLAQSQIEISKKRLETQLEKDGSQPHELARTASWNYANMNLLGFMTIARLAENLGVDLWNYQTENEKSIKSALDWMIPYYTNEKKWSHQQIKKVEFDVASNILTFASLGYKTNHYNKILQSLFFLRNGNSSDILLFVP